MRSLQLGLLAILFISVVSCGGSSTPPTNPTPTPTPTPPNPTFIALTISIPAGAAQLGTRAYSPSPVTVAPGATVRWSNDDSITHTTTSNTAVWTSGNISPGSFFDVTFQTAGTYAYHCAIHPGMVGTVVVQ